MVLEDGSGVASFSHERVLPLLDHRRGQFVEPGAGEAPRYVPGGLPVAHDGGPLGLLQAKCLLDSSLLLVLELPYPLVDSVALLDRAVEGHFGWEELALASLLGYGRPVVRRADALLLPDGHLSLLGDRRVLVPRHDSSPRKWRHLEVNPLRHVLLLPESRASMCHLCHLRQICRVKTPLFSREFIARTVDRSILEPLTKER